MKVIICGTICHNSLPHSVATKCYNAIRWINKRLLRKTVPWNRWARIQRHWEYFSARRQTTWQVRGKDTLQSQVTLEPCLSLLCLSSPPANPSGSAARFPAGSVCSVHPPAMTTALANITEEPDPLLVLIESPSSCSLSVCSLPSRKCKH